MELRQSPSTDMNLAKQLRGILRSVRWKRIHDFGPDENSFPEGRAPALQDPSNIDLSVLAIDAEGQVFDAANVVLSRDQPRGLISRLDNDLNSTNITWQRWDQARWDGTKPWISSSNDLPKKQHIKPQTGLNGDAIFMSPYPASLFKLPLAFFLLEDVSAGRLELKTIRRELRDMLTISDNEATKELLKLTHENGRISAMNRRFDKLGLGTIQIKGTDGKTGYSWNPGLINMTSMDTAKLLWLIQSDPSKDSLWDQPNGSKAKSKLNKKSQKILLRHLSNQAFNETLSTANFGVGGTDKKNSPPANIKPGIPNRVPEQWIDDITGFADFNADGIRINYGVDIRNYNKSVADKTFLHKTGITYNFGSDAGIVEQTDQPNKPRYIVSFFSNLGFRYVDAAFADRKSYPFYDDPGPIAHTQEIPQLGNQVDQLMDAILANQPGS